MLECQACAARIAFRTSCKTAFDIHWKAPKFELHLAGVVAQLVEHHNGIVGVRGSNPLGSTSLILSPRRRFEKAGIRRGTSATPNASPVLPKSLGTKGEG